MDKFKTNKISDEAELVAKELRRARSEKKISLEDASRETNINIKYLQALENGRFDLLPRGIYGKNFLKEYAEYLKTNVTEILTLAEPALAEKCSSQKNKLFSERVPRSFNALSLPRLLKGAVIAATVLVCMVYLASGFGKIISPPKLDIISPETNLITGKFFVDVQGYTEPEAEIIINGLSVLIDQNGYFTKKISLKNGLNTISISAQKKYSRKNNIVKKILVNNETSFIFPRLDF